MINQIEALKKNAIIMDIALGFEPEVEVDHKWDLLDQYQATGFNFVGLAIAGQFTSLETAIRYIARQRNRIISNPSKFVMVDKVHDIITAKQENKLALGFWLQGSTPLANDLNMVDVYYKLGVRYVLLCYNTRNAIGDGGVEKANGGLSQFGEQLIAEMNRVGMLIDMSHGGIKTSLDAIAVSNSPVIFSHSNVRALVPHVRNLTDEQIKAVAAKKGVIGISGNAMLLGSETSNSQKMFEHIDYIANLVGTDTIALGLDLIYFPEILPLFFEKAGNATYPKGYLNSNTFNSFPLEKIDELIEILLQHNYSTATISNILGGNFLRVASQVWK